MGALGGTIETTLRDRRFYFLSLALLYSTLPQQAERQLPASLAYPLIRSACY